MKYKLFIPLLVVLSLPLIFQSTPTELIKLRTFDKFVKEYEPSGNFVILNITEEDVERVTAKLDKNKPVLISKG